jgi:hypothetical protein
MTGARFQSCGEFKLEGGVTSLDVAPDGEYCLAGGADGTLVLLSADGAEVWRTRIGARVSEVRCSEGGAWCVALAEDRSLTVVGGDGRAAWRQELQHEASCIDLRPGSNLIAIGNRFGYVRHWSIHGKRMQQAEAPHPVDFIRYSPSGNICALGCEDGRLTLLGYGGERIWTALVHRMIVGLDVARRAEFIVAPSRKDGIVALDHDGNGVGVYELKCVLADAEIDDDGAVIVALDEEGTLFALDREARLLGRQELGMRAERLAVDSAGGFLAVAAAAGEVGIFRRSDQEADRGEFVEVSEKRGEMRIGGEDDAVRYLDL